MPKIFATLAAMLMGLSAALSSPAALVCPRIEAPAIDGALGSAEWAKAARVPPLVLDHGGMPSLVTEVRIGYDRRAFYVGARLHDPNLVGARTLTTTRDGAVLADDSLSVVLDRGNNGLGVVELAVNAKGIEYDAVDGSVTADLDWASATRIEDDDAWLVEIAYNFGAEGAPELGEVWGFNVRRNAPRIGERSSISGSVTNATVTFAWPAVTVEVGPPQSPWYGENRLEMRLLNHDRDEHTVKVNTRVTGPTRRAHSFEVRTLILAPGQARRIEAPYSVPRGGACALEISVQVVRGQHTLPAFRTARMQFELPALGAALDDALSEIAAAYFTYALLPAERRPFESAPQLDMLLARWRYLDSQHQQRASLTPDIVLALLLRVRTLSQDAILMRRDLDALSPPP